MCVWECLEKARVGCVHDHIKAEKMRSFTAVSFLVYPSCSSLLLSTEGTLAGFVLQELVTNETHRPLSGIDPVVASLDEANRLTRNGRRFAVERGKSEKEPVFARDDQRSCPVHMDKTR